MRNTSRLVAFVASAAFLIFFTILIPSVPAQAQRNGGGSSGGGSHGGGSSGGSAGGSSGGGSHSGGSGASGAAHASSGGGSHVTTSSHASSGRPSSASLGGTGDSRGGASAGRSGAQRPTSDGAGSATETLDTRTPRTNSWDPVQFAGVSGANLRVRSDVTIARTTSSAATGSKPSPTYHRRVDVKIHPKKKHPHQPPSNSGFYFLTGGGAYYLPSGSGDDGAAFVDDGAPDGSSVADANGVADDSQAGDASAALGADATAPNASDVARELSADAGATAPVPDEGEFTLVMRDGTRVQAIAFTHANKKIAYITTDGMRHAFADSLLDADETVRVNQERGTPLQLPL
jgi:hypothetical protein